MSQFNIFTKVFFKITSEQKDLVLTDLENYLKFLKREIIYKPEKKEYLKYNFSTNSYDLSCFQFFSMLFEKNVSFITEFNVTLPPIKNIENQQIVNLNPIQYSSILQEKHQFIIFNIILSIKESNISDDINAHNLIHKIFPKEFVFLLYPEFRDKSTIILFDKNKKAQGYKKKPNAVEDNILKNVFWNMLICTDDQQFETQFFLYSFQFFPNSSHIFTIEDFKLYLLFEILFSVQTQQLLKKSIYDILCRLCSTDIIPNKKSCMLFRFILFKHLFEMYFV